MVVVVVGGWGHAESTQCGKREDWEIQGDFTAIVQHQALFVCFCACVCVCVDTAVACTAIRGIFGIEMHTSYLTYQRLWEVFCCGEVFRRVGDGDVGSVN